jgi:hypothetical protein
VITILIQIDDAKDVGMLAYQSSKADTACFIDMVQVTTVLSTVREIVKDAEVI